MRDFYRARTEKASVEQIADPKTGKRTVRLISPTGKMLCEYLYVGSDIEKVILAPDFMDDTYALQGLEIVLKNIKKDGYDVASGVARNTRQAVIFAKAEGHPVAKINALSSVWEFILKD